MKKVFLDDLPHKGSGKSIDWKKSIGYKVRFIYNDIIDNMKIIDYYRKNKRAYLKIQYNKFIDIIEISNFKAVRLGRILGLILYKYKYQVGDIINDVCSGKLQILEQIRVPNGKNTQKGYKYKCLICGNEDIISETNLTRGAGCSVCGHNKVLKGYNDIWTTNPDLVKLLANPNDGYKYTEHSEHKVDWKCPNCHNIIKNKRISDINRRGLLCPKCSDSISYPEKFMFNVLKQLNLKFIYQLSKTNYKWCNKYRYDFYFKFNNKKYIIETHGIQHYQESFSRCQGRSLKEEQENDKLKEELAINNGINKDNYIVIDCRKSTLEWIRSNILKSKLNKLFDLNRIDWLDCHKYACNSLIKQACDLWNNKNDINKISKIMQLSDTTIRSYLKIGNRIYQCNYNAKEIIRNIGKRNGGYNKRKIICLNTNKIFDSIISAQTYSNLKSNNGIIMCCKNSASYAGIDLNTKEYLQWQYYDDYLIKPKKLLSNDDINKTYNHKKHKIICLNDNNIFKSMIEAKNYYNLKSVSNIGVCCQGKRKSCGTNPITGAKLHWMYCDEYLKKKESNI